MLFAGDSAGGHMAASVSLKLRDDKFSPMPKAQILMYPVTQIFDLDLPSYNSNDNTAFGSKMWMANFFVHLLDIHEGAKYTKDFAENKHVSVKTRKKFEKFFDISSLPEKFKKNYQRPKEYSNINTELATMMDKYLSDPYLSPLIADNLRNLPDALVLTVEHDVLRDDGFLYANRLRQYGVPVIHTHYEDTFHAVFNAVIPPLDNEAGISMINDIATYVKRQLNV